MKMIFLFICLLTANLLFAGQDISRQVKEFARASREFQKIEQQNFASHFFSLQKNLSPDSTDFDQLYYDLNFVVTTSPENLEGTVTGYFRSNVNGLDRVKLNFDSREDIGDWKDLAVTGNVSGFSLSNLVLRVDLDKPYGVGEEFSITVHYSGLPRSSGFKAFEFDHNSAGDLVISTLSEPYLAQTWWPCKDDPSDKLDSVKISATVPEDMIVASNGLLQSVTPGANNTKTFLWKEKYPITTYLVSLAISNYVTFSDSFEYQPGKFMPIDYFVYPGDFSTAQTAFAKVPQMLRAYSDAYGLYPFVEEKYGHAEFVWGGAMEHQTCTSIGRVSNNWETVYAHELSHQWFGDLVTCHDWHNIWMNEGFATFSEALWLESAYGKTAYHDYVNYYLDDIDSWATDHVYRYTTDNPGYIFHRTVYVKGMWVLHMLRHLMGDEVFFQIMKQYPYDPAFFHKDVTTEQFRDFCEQIYGQDLDWFFQQWIYQPYYPNYQWGYLNFQQDQRNYVYLLIKQVQDEVGYPHLYKMPVDVVVEYASGDPDTLVLWDSLRVQGFQLAVREKPQLVHFDPDRWVLKKAEQIPVSILDIPGNLASEFKLYPNFPNPFNRETRIPFAIDQKGSVQLEIYDVLGRKVRSLAEGYFEQGAVIDWDGTDERGNPVSSGVYFYRLQFHQREQTRKMLLIR